MIYWWRKGIFIFFKASLSHTLFLPHFVSLSLSLPLRGSILKMWLLVMAEVGLMELMDRKFCLPFHFASSFEVACLAAL